MDLPVFECLDVFTKRERDKGFAHNGIHIPEIQKVELILSVYEHPFIVRECYDCKQENIKKGSVFGTENMSRPRCHNCIEIPAGVEAWEVIVKMKKKTRQHPKGILKLRKVQYPAILRDYFDQIGKIYQIQQEQITWKF